MIKILCDKANATLQSTETLTAGRVGLTVEFDFSSDWSGLGKTVFFRAGDKYYDVVLDGNETTVPAEVMADSGVSLIIGVRGVGSDSVIPTIWCACGQILPAGTVTEADNYETVTEELSDQIIAIVRNADAQATAAAVSAASAATSAAAALNKEINSIVADSTEADVVGTASVEYIEDWSSSVRDITFKFKNLKGVTGNGIASVVESTDGTITITYTDGTSNVFTSIKDAIEDLTALESRVSDAESYRASAETERVSAETARSSAESSRAEAEASRVSAESARASAEETRESNEATRKQNETTRKSNETKRNNAETARETAEESRVTAEEGRVTAEEGRVSAETARAEEFAGFSGTIEELKEDLDAEQTARADADSALKETVEHHTHQLVASKEKIENIYNLIEGIAYSRDEKTSTDYILSVPQYAKIGADGYGYTAIKKVSANVNYIVSAERFFCVSGYYALKNFDIDSDGTIISGSTNAHYFPVKAGEKYFFTQNRPTTTYTTYYYTEVPVVGSTPISNEALSITVYRGYNTVPSEERFFTAKYDGYVLVGLTGYAIAVYKHVEMKAIPDAVQALDGWNVCDFDNDLYNYIDFETCTFHKVCEKNSEGNIVECEEVITDLVPLGIDEDFALFKIHSTFEGEYATTSSIIKNGLIRFYNTLATTSDYGKAAYDVIFETEVSE